MRILPGGIAAVVTGLAWGKAAARFVRGSFVVRVFALFWRWRCSGGEGLCAEIGRLVIDGIDIIMIINLVMIYNNAQAMIFVTLFKNLFFCFKLNYSLAAVIS